MSFRNTIRRGSRRPLASAPTPDTIYAFDTQTGKTLWTTKAPAGINSFPAIDGDTLLVGAGAAGFNKKPHFQLIAYSLS
jgi:outer membrane protein assembly factor BamB